MGGIWQRSKKKRKEKQKLPRTSVVLLLLVVVAELPLTLCCHPTLCLHHLFHLIWAALVPLGGIEALEIARGGHARVIEFADRVVTLGAAGDTGIFSKTVRKDLGIFVQCYIP